MPRKSGAKKIIVEELQKSELSKKKIYDIVIKRAKLASSRPGKIIDRYLFDLLKEGTIGVVEFDLSVIIDRIPDIIKEGEIIRNVSADGMVFALLKKKYIDTLSLVKSSELSKRELNILRNMFKTKIQHIHDLKESNWREKETCIKLLPLQLFLGKITKNLIQEKVNIEVFSLKTNKFLNLQDLQTLNKKNKNANIIFFRESPIESELRSTNKKSLTIRQTAKILSLNTKYIDETGSWTPKRFLEYHGFEPMDKIKTSEEINNLFNEIIFYIGSQTIENKEKLQNKFAWGLSDEFNSDGTFAEFIKEYEQNKRLLELQDANRKLDKLLD